MRVHLVATVLAALVASGFARASQAQPAPEQRPVYILFGAPDPRRSPQEALDGGLSASGSLFGAYDDNLLSSQLPVTSLPTGPSVSGMYAGVSGRLIYTYRNDNFEVRADVSSIGRYYPDFDLFSLGRQVASGMVSTGMDPWRSARLSATGGARYSLDDMPFSMAAFFPDDPVNVGEVVSPFGTRWATTAFSSVQLSQDWGRRKSVAVMAGVNWSDLEAGGQTIGYEVGGTFNSKVGRYGSFQAGLTRHVLDRGFTSYVVHHINFGGNYGRPLSSSKRAYYTLGGGSAILQSNSGFRVFAVADAGLTYEFKRSWTGGVRYHRGFTFVDEITEPLLSDTVVGEVNGLLSRRLQLLASGYFSTGVVGLTSASRDYKISAARTQLRFALSRISAIQAEYLFLHYDYPVSVHLLGNLPRRFNRQILLVGITLSLQLID